MRIAITGATGFVGKRLSQQLAAAGNEILPVSRSTVPGGVRWDPERGWIDAAALEGVDVVVHLAGENVAGVWTASKKRRILESRVRGTQLLATTLASLRAAPSVLFSGSAIDYYPRDGGTVDESGPAGASFLAHVAREWERAAAPAADAGIRVVHPRLGMVLGAGGPIGVMLPLFRLGLGGPIGSGRQIISWVALDEIAPALLHLLATPELSGAVNVVSPNAVSFSELARELAAVLHRPAFFRLPAFAARLALGQFGEEILLTGSRIVPRRLQESGYEFRFPELRGALEHALTPAR